MLNKLLKHEYKQTGKMFVPLFIGLLGLVLATYLTAFFPEMNISNNLLADFFDMLFIMLFSLAIIALVAINIVTQVIIIVRYYKNMLGDEGYLMHTLPVTASQHLGSKIIVAFTWQIISAMVSMFAFLLLMFRASDTNIFSEISLALEIVAAEFGNGIYATIFIGVLMLLISLVVNTLTQYMIIAIGGQWPSNRLGATVLSYFGFQIAAQLVGMIVSALVINIAYKTGIMQAITVFAESNQVATMNIMFAITGILLAVIGVATFFVIRWLMSKKLNLA